MEKNEQVNTQDRRERARCAREREKRAVQERERAVRVTFPTSAFASDDAPHFGAFSSPPRFQRSTRGFVWVMCVFEGVPLERSAVGGELEEAFVWDTLDSQEGFGMQRRTLQVPGPPAAPPHDIDEGDLRVEF